MYRSLTRAASLLLVLGVGTFTAAFTDGTSRPVTPRAPVFTGTVRGRVTDKEGGAPIVSVQVAIVGTRAGAVTNNNGEYTIANVAAGAVTVRATRIGYQPATVAVTVSDNGMATANLILEKSVAKLQEVVTTATGEQSRVEVGNVIGSVKMDSITAIMPIRQIGDALGSRTSGVITLQGLGQTGAAPTIRIRGTSSLQLNNDPLIIVDNVRYTGGTGTVGGLIDVNTEEIESVDVIKGPSAAALYGTAAANGVIVIKTKKGASGNTKWQTFFEGGRVGQPSHFDANYQSWGHNLTSTGAVTGGNILCRIYVAAVGQCHIDSLTSNNPYSNPLTNPFAKQTPRDMYGVQVSGGTEQVRYFVSGSKEAEVGPFTMPDTDIKRLTAVQGQRPIGIQINPNQLHQTTARGNFSLALAPNTTLDISSGYVDRALYSPFDGGFFAGMTFQLQTAPGYVTGTNGTQREYVGNVFQVANYNSEQRWTSSATLNWLALSWLNAHATAGFDEGNRFTYTDQLLGQGPNVAAAWGPGASQGFSGIDLARIQTNRYSVDAGVTATKAVTSTLQSRTTGGVQYFKDETYTATGEGYGFGPGVSTPNSASQRGAGENTNENATYGAFIEENLAFRDKLFLSGAVRTDQNSAVGRNVGTTIYPHGSLSYLISDEDWFPNKGKLGFLNRLRLRVAYGQAGVQPTTTAALQFLTAGTYPINGTETPQLTLAAVGNLALKPEVTTETEIGADFSLWQDRVTVEFTHYNKQSHQALIAVPLPPSFGAGASQFQNLGQVSNIGQELTIDAQVLRSRNLTWDVGISGAHIANKLVTVGNVSLSTAAGTRNVVGYPISGLWDIPIKGYTDANGDKIITEQEVVTGDTQVYRGNTLPVLTAGLTNRIGMFNGKLNFNLLWDYRGVYYQQWAYENQRCVSTGNCLSVNVPGASFADQAANVMAASSTRRTQWGYMVPGDFIRFREASASIAIPSMITDKMFRAHNATLIVSGRNIGMLWSKYPGLDPEVGQTSEPLLRYWLARINVAF